ncbi:MAG TPA: sterol desaturase family protein [Candidatus Binataceae bacterium]|nr:sterol desaturase family protein [Candidatus Binataceae bacterium]
MSSVGSVGVAQAGTLDARRKRRIKHTRTSMRAGRRPTYRWWRHAAALAAISATTIAVSVSQLIRVTPLEWICFGGFLLLANFGEYWLHRIPFHNPIIPDFTYYGHTREHHAFFGYERMAIDDLNDLRFVMFDLGVELLTIAGAIPLAALFYFGASHNLGWLFMLAVICYYSIYEVTHALSHLPAGNPIGEMKAVKAMSYHHRVHHDARLMRHYNFNFAVPIFDWMFGTKYRGPAPSRAETIPSAAAHQTSSAGHRAASREAGLGRMS